MTLTTHEDSDRLHPRSGDPVLPPNGSPVFLIEPGRPSTGRIADQRTRDETTDAELVRQVRRGGEHGQASYGQIVERYERWLLRLCMHLVRDRDLAMDVAQDTFVKAFFSLDGLRDDAKLKPWLRVIATRRAFNTLRNAKRRRLKHAASPLPIAPRSAEGELGQHEAVWKTLWELSRPFREVLVLRYLEEATIAELASTLRIGTSAVKMRLLRAREEFAWIYQSKVSGRR